MPTAKTYNGIAADEYEIGLVQYRTLFSSSLPDTLVRGYVQLTACNKPGAFPLSNAFVVGPDVATGYCGVTPPQYLGPVIAATKDKPVRIVFRNLLAPDAGGELFLPADSTIMGSGDGPIAMNPPVDQGTVLDEVRNPMCSEPYDPMMNPTMCFTENRATLHLHGGITPWISDGTAHQWITPAGENTSWPQGAHGDSTRACGVIIPGQRALAAFIQTTLISQRERMRRDYQAVAEPF